jgi:hypothetical protein
VGNALFEDIEVGEINVAELHVRTPSISAEWVTFSGQANKRLFISPAGTPQGGWSVVVGQFKPTTDNNLR